MDVNLERAPSTSGAFGGRPKNPGKGIYLPALAVQQIPLAAVHSAQAAGALNNGPVFLNFLGTRP